MDVEILQWFNVHNNLFVDRLATALTFGWTWLPLYVALALLVIKNNKTMGQVGIIFACGLLGVALAGGVSDIIVKPLTMRLRPCYDPELHNLLHIVDGVNPSGYSFFSSHSANTFSLAMFFCLLTRSTALSVTLFSWATVNAWTRLSLACHYPSDVAVGILWGLLVGALVYFGYYKVYYSFNHRTKYISTQYTSTGYAKTDVDICISIIVFTVIYAIIKSLI